VFLQINVSPPDDKKENTRDFQCKHEERNEAEPELVPERMLDQVNIDT
jgi:hypothetical protein